MNKIILMLTVFILSILIWNCDTNEPKEITDEFSDESIKNAVYNGPKFPSDFFHEGLADVILNYIMKADLITFTEPATDNYDTALVWVNIRLGELSLDTTNLIDGQSNEKYFEFYWPHPALSGPVYVFRVHKSSYFESVKFGSQDENFYQIIELGIINYRPFTLQFVKDFFDQLWFYKHYNMSGAVVLKRTITENANSYKYTIYFTHTVFGDYGIRDKIRLLKGEFDLNKSNGTSIINYTLIKEVLGNSN
jgi:hypothetical protein